LVDHRIATHFPGQSSAQKPIVWMARVGYAARGLVFLIVGAFALLAASGAARPQGMSDAMQTLFERPFGGFLLWTVAAGLACFACWRFLQSFLDADRHGRSLNGLMRRGSYAVGGLFYLALAAAIARMAFGTRGLNEDQSARDWTELLMAQPLGRALIALLAAVLVGIAIGLTVKVLLAPYRRGLDAHLTTRAWADALGAFGFLTRAFVFLMLGCFLGFAAYDSNSREAIGLTGVLRTVQQQSYGGLLLGIAGLGFLAFGCFEIIKASARRVRPPKMPAMPKDQSTGGLA
jgi:hypothetical protein